MTRLFTWPANHPRRAIALGAVLAVLSFFCVFRLRPDTSLENLFSRNDQAAAALVRVMNNFSAVEELLVFVTAPGSDPAPEELLAFAARFDDGVKSSPSASAMSAGVVYRADAQMRDFFEKVLVPNGIFYLDDDAFRAARQRLTLPEMRKQIEQNQAMLTAPGPAAGALSKVLLKDPLHLRDFILDKLAGSRPFATYQNSDAFLSADGRSLLIRVRGRRPLTDLNFAKAFTMAIEDVANAANTDQLQIELAGSYAIAATAERSIRNDMTTGIFTSVISLQVLFLLAYRRPFRSFLLAFIPIAIGIVYGFGAYALISPTLSPMSAVIGGVLAGMAIDYSIQYLSHYDVRHCAFETSRALAPAIVAAWITSIFGFIAIGSSQVKALRDFSLLGTLGLTGAFVGAAFLLPAILNQTENKAEPLSRFSIDPLLALISRKRIVLLAISVLISLVCCFPFLRPANLFSLDSDLTVMHPHPNPALDAQQHIAERFGTSPGSLIIHLRADSDEALVALAHQVDEHLHSDEVHDAGIQSIYSLASLLPDPALASSRVAQTGEAYANRVLGDFDQAIAGSVFSSAAYDPYREFLRHLLTRTASPGIDQLRAYPSLSETLLPTSSSNHESLALVFTPSDSTRASRDRTIDVLRH